MQLEMDDRSSTPHRPASRTELHRRRSSTVRPHERDAPTPAAPDRGPRRRRGRVSTGSSSRAAPSCTRTATGCSAPSTTPRTRCRRRCCAPGAGCRASRTAARCARGSTGSRPTRASTSSRGGRSAVLPIDFGPGADPHDSPGRADRASRSGSSRTRTPEARYEQREGVELAFVAALQHLPATQRAVLILREVLGFSAAEVADDARHDGRRRSTARCSGRARRSTSGSPSRASRRRCARSATSGSRELVERYMAALERATSTRVVALLTEDATWSMPPCPLWYRGDETVRGLPQRVPAAASAGATSRRAPTASSPSAVTCGTASATLRRGARRADAPRRQGRRRHGASSPRGCSAASARRRAS